MSPCSIVEEARPCLIRLADKDHICETVEVVFLNRHPGAPYHHELPPSFEFREDLLHAEALDAHAGDAEDIHLV
jgi:hypothetical protein